MKKTILALALFAGLTSFAGNAKAQSTDTNSTDSNNLTDFTIETVAYDGGEQVNPAVRINRLFVGKIISCLKTFM